MRVRLLRPWASPDFNRPAGAEVEVAGDLARSLADDRAAEPLEPFPEPADPAKPRGRRKPADPSAPVPPAEG